MSTEYRNFLSPRELGSIVKGCEVQFHPAVHNQSLWNLFYSDEFTANRLRTEIRARTKGRRWICATRADPNPG